ncbi:SAV_2336 N-terminal domain-related protein [Streptomyces sp. Q6]|uniref:SAV_2336 N-terminal domain-related protein n=1 Tax=Streptomyces citrinus TaxID=3118173 RepID=A0ACD5AB52_9ACTN
MPGRPRTRTARRAPPPPPPAPPRPAPARVTLYVQREEPPTPGTLLAPTPPMLRHPLDLQRALRPLGRRVPSPTGARVIDEHATADRIARLGGGPDAWLPVLRPAPERWLRLALVHDTGPTMPIWHPLLRELHTALTQSGLFRTVSVHPATPDGRVQRLSPPADGRTVVLLLSDCTGPQWHPGDAGTRWLDTLHRLARRAPLAVLQPLPERLWRTTALPATAGRLASPHPAAPSAALRFTPYDTEERAPRGALAVPVLEAEPRWLAHWSRLTGAPGGADVPGAAAWLTREPAESARPARALAASPEELVLDFRATASPEAFRLAGHLAVGAPHLPVMRLIQATLERRPRPSHLAEVILSGMLTQDAGPPGSYAFRPGVRALLLRTLPRSARGRTTLFLAERGALIDDRAGAAPGDFAASTRGAREDAVAAVTEESVRRLGGRYLLDRAIGARGSVWLARDLDQGGTVIVERFATSDPAAFRRVAGRLTGLDHPNVARVLDHGFTDGDAYVVMEHLDGIPLDALLRTPRLIARRRDRLAQDLARGVRALHDAGVTLGELLPSRVLLLPDGTTKLTRFWYGPHSAYELRQDLLELGRLLASFDIVPHVALALAGPDAHAADRALFDLAEGQLANSPDPLPPERSFQLLGAPRITLPNGDLATPGPRQQAFLCALLSDPGRVVPLAAIAHALWGDEPPSDAGNQIAAWARRSADDDVALIAKTRTGYAVHISADHLDVDVLASREVDVATAVAAGDTEAARAHATAALDLFYGTPLDGVPGPGAAQIRAHLEERRFALRRQLVELDLDSGDLDRAEAALVALLVENPGRADLLRMHARTRGRLGTPPAAPSGGRLAHASALFSAQDARPGQVESLAAELTAVAGLGPDTYRMSTTTPTVCEVVLTDAAATDLLLATTVEHLTRLVAETPVDGRVSVTFWPMGSRIPIVASHLPAPVEVTASLDLVPRERALALGMRPLSPLGGAPDVWKHQLLARSTVEQLGWVIDDVTREWTSTPLRHALVDSLNTALRSAGLTPRLDASSPGPVLASAALRVPDGRRALLEAVVRYAPTSVARVEEALAHQGAAFPPGLLTAALTETRELNTPAQLTLCARLLHDLLDIHMVSPVDAGELAEATLGHPDGLSFLCHLVDHLAGTEAATEFVRRVGSGLPVPHSRDSVPSALDDRFRLAEALRSRPMLDTRARRRGLADALAAELGRPVALAGPRRADALALAHAALNHPTGRQTLNMLVERLRLLAPPASPAPPDSFARGPLPLPGDGVDLTPNTVPVYVRPDGSLTLTAPQRSEFSWEFYEIDLTQYTYDLDEVLLGARVDVRVADPVEVALAPDLDLPTLLAERLTQALHGGDRAAAEEELDRRPLPGYTVRWRLPKTVPERGPEPAAPAPAHASGTARILNEVLTTAEAYLLGFDGLLLDLHTQRHNDTAALANYSAGLLAHRGRLDGPAASDRLPVTSSLDSRPLDVLRFFADDAALSRALRERLEELELSALRTARPHRDADLLVRALNATGRPVSVVSDVAPHVISTYLQGRSPALRAAVHGRSDDPDYLMPHPDVLHRALHLLGVPTQHGVLIGSSPAELRAARAIDLPFVGYAATSRDAARLTEDGALLVVRHLSELVDAARGIRR